MPKDDPTDLFNQSPNPPPPPVGSDDRAPASAFDVEYQRGVAETSDASETSDTSLPDCYEPTEPEAAMQGEAQTDSDGVPDLPGQDDLQEQAGERVSVSGQPQIEPEVSPLVRHVTLEYPVRILNLEQIIIEEDRKRSQRHNALEFDLLKKSLTEAGQIYPVFCIAEDPADEHGDLVLITGFRRYQALKELGVSTIAASVVPAGSLLAELIPIDDNLCHARMSKAELLSAVKRRCAVMKRALAETTVDKKKKNKGRPPNEVVQEVARAFELKDNTVRDYLRIAKKLPEGAEELLTWTSLDGFNELLALGELPRDVQTDLITKAAAGEKVSAINVLAGREMEVGAKAAAPARRSNAAAAKQGPEPTCAEDPVQSIVTPSGRSLWGMFLGSDAGFSDSERDEFLAAFDPHISWFCGLPRGLQAFTVRAFGAELMAQNIVPAETLAAEPANPDKTPFRRDASIRDLIAAGFLPTPIVKLTGGRWRPDGSYENLSWKDGKWVPLDDAA